MFFVSACSQKNEKRLHVLPENPEGWYFVVENQEQAKKTITGKELSVYLYPETRICRISGNVPIKWGMDSFVTLAGVELNSTPNSEPEAIAIRGRSGGTVEQSGTMISYHAFFVGNQESFVVHEKLKVESLRNALKK